MNCFVEKQTYETMKIIQRSEVDRVKAGRGKISYRQECVWEDYGNWH